MKKKKRGVDEMKKLEKIIYAIVIGFAVISFWRGVWGLWDQYVFPNNRVLSLWLSTIMGLAILIFTHKIIKEKAYNMYYPNGGRKKLMVA